MSSNIKKKNKWNSKKQKDYYENSETTTDTIWPLTTKHWDTEKYQTSERRIKFLGHLGRLHRNKPTKRLLNYVTSHKTLISLVIVVKKDLVNAKIDKANVNFCRNTFRNKIDKWEVTREEMKPKPCRPNWTEKRMETLRETVKKYW